MAVVPAAGVAAAGPVRIVPRARFRSLSPRWARFAPVAQATIRPRPESVANAKRRPDGAFALEADC